uniref:Upregulator of cell proliferation n=1 Tax=Mesocestoides corti TaxID=53468 RepID=A0A5K3EZ39_MESCO
ESTTTPTEPTTTTTVSKETTTSTTSAPSASKKASQQTTLMVCFYKPAGNKQGEKPYQKGQSCSACPADTHCDRKQCVTNSASTLMSTVVAVILAMLAIQCFA